MTAPPIELREIDVNVTNLCNLTCVYCSYASTPSRHEPALDRPVLDRLLDEAAAMGTKVVHFSGGEPVIRRDMPELIARAHGLGFKMRMHSNGMLLTPRKLDELWDAGLRQVLVSLDGFAEQHDRHRQREGLYPRTIRGIESAVARGYDVRVNSVATADNVDEIPRLLPLVAALGAATFSVFYLIPIGRGRDQQRLMVPPGRWRQFVEELREAAARYGRQDLEVTVEKVFSFSEDWDEDELTGGRGDTCLGFLERCNYVNVLADGRVYPCVCFIDEAPPLGDVRERPLGDILHDPAGWAFYRDLVDVNATCAGCECLTRCRGGSRALSRVARRDWHALDPRCTGDPRAQGYAPVCFMQRQNIRTGSLSGFAERVRAEAS